MNQPSKEASGSQAHEWSIENINNTTVPPILGMYALKHEGLRDQTVFVNILLGECGNVFNF